MYPGPRTGRSTSKVPPRTSDKSNKLNNHPEYTFQSMNQIETLRLSSTFDDFGLTLFIQSAFDHFTNGCRIQCFVKIELIFGSSG